MHSLQPCWLRMQTVRLLLRHSREKTGEGGVTVLPETRPEKPELIAWPVKARATVNEPVPARMIET